MGNAPTKEDDPIPTHHQYETPKPVVIVGNPVAQTAGWTGSWQFRRGYPYPYVGPKDSGKYTREFWLQKGRSPIEWLASVGHWNPDKQGTKVVLVQRDGDIGIVYRVYEWRPMKPWLYDPNVDIGFGIEPVEARWASVDWTLDTSYRPPEGWENTKRYYRRIVASNGRAAKDFVSRQRIPIEKRLFSGVELTVHSGEQGYYVNKYEPRVPQISVEPGVPVTPIPVVPEPRPDPSQGYHGDITHGIGWASDWSKPLTTIWRRKIQNAETRDQADQWYQKRPLTEMPSMPGFRKGVKEIDNEYWAEYRQTSDVTPNPPPIPEIRIAFDGPWMVASNNTLVRDVTGTTIPSKAEAWFKALPIDKETVPAEGQFDSIRNNQGKLQVVFVIKSGVALSVADIERIKQEVVDRTIHISDWTNDYEQSSLFYKYYLTVSLNARVYNKAIRSIGDLTLSLLPFGAGWLLWKQYRNR